MDYFFIWLLVFGGPAMGMVALVICLMERTRPGRFPRTLGALGILCSLPVALWYFAHPGDALVTVRRGTALLGVVAAISYFEISFRHKLPARRCAAAAVLLVACLWDGVSVEILRKLP